MRYLRPSHGDLRAGRLKLRRACAGTGFTLVELLVAMVVMTVIMAMFSQMLGSVFTIWSQVKGGVDDYTAARGVLDSLQVDLSKAVIRRDLAAFWDSAGDSPQLAFYTERAGLDAAVSDRQLQLVSYSLQPTTTTASGSTTTMTLQRSALQMAWTDSAPPSFGTTNSFPQLGSAGTTDANSAQGVLAMSMNFLNADGTLSPSFMFGNSQAVTVSLVVLSGRANQQLTAGQKTGLETKFTNAASGASATTSVESLWNQILNDTSFWHGYPSSSAGDIRVFARTYWLPVQGAN